MARGENQKRKLLYLAQMFMEMSDEEHPLSMSDIINGLASHDVNADRKTLYQDFEELRRFGMDIVMVNNSRHYGYYLGQRDFELAELKLLVDSVQSARFISEKKSAELIRKLSGLTSRYEARHLQRQVYLGGRLKSRNENIYYAVDGIYAAIEKNVQIRFHYFRWNLRKEAQLRREGAWYVVSPWGLLQDSENYYLIAYDASDRQIKHYRVDKILHITQTQEPREGEEAFSRADPAHYSARMFGMFAGEEKRVMFEARNDMIGVLIDRFGKDIPVIEADRDHFRTYADVSVSDQFLGWVIALGDGIRIAGPPDVTEKMREIAERLQKQYGYEDQNGGD